MLPSETSSWLGVGWAIDSASVADNKCTSPVNLTLIP